MNKEQELLERFKETFPKDFYLWSELGFWLSARKSELEEIEKEIDALPYVGDDAINIHDVLSIIKDHMK